MKAGSSSATCRLLPDSSPAGMHRHDKEWVENQIGAHSVRFPDPLPMAIFTLGLAPTVGGAVTLVFSQVIPPSPILPWGVGQPTHWMRATTCEESPGGPGPRQHQVNAHLDERYVRC